MHIHTESLLLVWLCKGLILKTCQKKAWCKTGPSQIPDKLSVTVSPFVHVLSQCVISAFSSQIESFLLNPLLLSRAKYTSKSGC